MDLEEESCFHSKLRSVRGSFGCCKFSSETRLGKAAADRITVRGGYIFEHPKHQRLRPQAWRPRPIQLQGMIDAVRSGMLGFVFEVLSLGIRCWGVR